MPGKIVIVYSNKGGVGKSFIARTVADYYDEIGHEWRSFDADHSGGRFWSFYRERVTPADLRSPQTMRPIIESARESFGVSLVDVPAAHGRRAQTDTRRIQNGPGRASRLNPDPREAGHAEKDHTLMADNGREFAQHQVIARQPDADFFFAHPYCTREWGLNENTNGLVRQYFPKKSDFKRSPRLT